MTVTQSKKRLNSLYVPLREALSSLYTSIDVTQLNGYLVGWGVVSVSQSELQELKNTKIAFASN